MRHLHFTTLFRIFATLIEKDGGIRPCDVLATCAQQGAKFYLSALQIGKISESPFTNRLFDISAFWDYTDQV